MKKVVLLIACIIAIFSPVATFAANVTKIVITTTQPQVGKKPSYKASVPATASTEVYEVQWNGEFDNGAFVQGRDYTMTVKLRIKASSSNVFSMSSNINVTINGHKAKVAKVSKKNITVNYTWKLKNSDSSAGNAVKKDVPITTMKTWLLVVKDGKPHYKAMDGTSLAKENYILFDVKYEHPDGVKPFTFTTAVATFKAKEGYYFDKKLKLNDRTPQAENTTGFKRIDSKTVKVYLTAFTGDMGYDVRITPAMKEYKNNISTMNLTPVATAQINAPLFDYWTRKLRYGDILVEGFVDNNMRAFYAYPTTEQSRDINGVMVKDAKRSEYPSNYKILSIDILDDDLSDDIPGLVGEWCLVDNKEFIPKSCLKDIKYGARYDGAPAVIVDSPFQFAGGSGTFEDPYLIETAEQLNAVRKGPSNHYKLIADIDLSDWGNWVPIGGTASYGFLPGWDKADKGAHTFYGSFDGNGHVVSGMQIVINEPTPHLTEGENWRAYGLFANVGTNPAKYKIKNLGVVNFNIDVNYTDVKTVLRLYAAAISGGMNQGVDFLNCYSKGGRISINVKGNDAYKPTGEWGELPGDAPYIHIHAGGLCSDGGGAFFEDSGLRKHLEFIHIEKCFNDSDITVKAENCKYEIYGAGIISAMAETHIHECYNSGNITLPLDLTDLLQQNYSTYAAGISAFASIREIGGIHHYNTEQTSFIQNCYNSGQIIGRMACGIFGASVSDIHLENCYNTGVIIGNEFDYSSDGWTMDPILSQSNAVIPYGKEFVRNCYTNGNSVAGTMWKTSATLGRKVLAAIPEDTHPGNKYNVEPADVGTFTDVKEDVWYADAVKWAFDKGIVSGTTFSPEKTCTRVQLITFLWNMAGSPKSSAANPFSDVKDTDSHYDAALWASEKGIINGSSFAPQTALTRGEFVISLWKYLGCPEGIQVNQYLDIDSHQSDFGRALAWSHVNGIMGATEQNKFSPKKTISKADVINIMYRALK
ncbi:MAG: S-layer homology domain-containing protein [Bacteroidales bacterium]|nr:S-layer homology domain-containing protein [Bacteroidales bacterium]